MPGISSHSLPSYMPTVSRAKRIGIGRFMQGDPKMEATIRMSGYVFSGNNPVMFTDLLGDQYKYMDKMGNRWHHADVLEGTALEGQQYIEGFGLDGFGDSWIGDVQNGGGGGGRNNEVTSGSSASEILVQIISASKNGFSDIIDEQGKSVAGVRWNFSDGHAVSIMTLANDFKSMNIYTADGTWTVNLTESIYQNASYSGGKGDFIIRNGKKVMWDDIKTGTSTYGLGSLIRTVIKVQYSDEGIKDHLQERMKTESNISETLDWSSFLGGFTPISKNPAFAVFGLLSFFESKHHSYKSEAYSEGLFMYMNMANRHGLWLIESRETHSMSGTVNHVGMSEYYIPNGPLLFSLYF